MKRGRAWAIKCTERNRGKADGWHWKHYFPPTSVHDPDEIWNYWGGDDWIRDPRSMMFLPEIAFGDLAVCYQADDPTYGRAIIGLTRFASGGKEASPASGEYDCFDLCAPNDSFPFDPPLRIDYLYTTGCRPTCFGLVTQWTIFPMSRLEVDGIVAAIRKHSRTQKKELRRWLARV